MIIDCHTHIWKSQSQLGKAISDRLRKPSANKTPQDKLPEASPEHHHATCKPVDKTVVLGFRSRYQDASVPNELVAEYVQSHRDRLIGFAGVDPSEPVEAIEEMRRACGQLGLRGISVSPVAQDFHPSSTGALRVFAEAAKLGIPVLIHPGLSLTPSAKLEFLRPWLLDEVARELPSLKIIVAHMGYPWVDECITLLAKQPNVYADISSVVCRPWHAYTALLSAYQCGVVRKLLFGSNFPFSSPAASIEALYSINQLSHGTGLPTIPREQLRSIVEENAQELLGLAAQAPRRETVAATVLDDEDL